MRTFFALLMILIIIASMTFAADLSEPATAAATASAATAAEENRPASKHAAPAENAAPDKPADHTTMIESPVGRDNPFAPSESVKAAAPQSSVESRTAESGRPVLEGVIVSGREILACFRLGDKAVIVSPGESMGDEPQQFLFVSFDGRAATIRSDDGREHLVRLNMKTMPDRPRATVSQPVE